MVKWFAKQTEAALCCHYIIICINATVNFGWREPLISTENICVKVSEYA